MRIGLHVSIAGGLGRACARAAAFGCDTFQVFTRSPRGWQARPLEPAEVTGFRRALETTGIAPVFVHAPYLVNLATPDRKLAARSVATLAGELERAALIGAVGVVVHPGRAADRDPERVLARVARQVERTLKRAPGPALLLIENTAGTRGDVGSRFAELAGIIARVKQPDRLGVTLDTCHLFAAGYELRTRPELDRTLREFDAAVGFGRLHLLHLNDSRFGLGTKRDRHWHIGQGEIGLDGFRTIVNHPLLRHLPGVLETPRTNDDDDRRNLAAVRTVMQ